MKRMKYLIIGSAALLLTSGWALAQDGEEGEGEDLDDVTMTLMSEEGEDQEAVMNEIELPMDDDGYIPSEEGVTNSGVGLDTANAALEDGRDFGQDAKEAAEENRERFGRGGRAPDLEDLLPDNAPDLSGTPAPPVEPGQP